MPHALEDPAEAAAVMDKKFADVDHARLKRRRFHVCVPS